MRSFVYNVYLALNMLLASLLPGGLPRETISGRVGRCWPDSAACMFIDVVHWWDPEHCVQTALLEAAAREELGYAPR